ncbi:MAG TPA: enoyl-CoA hydratase/isomerase family protein [Candidatus Thermoplasmatota archaeon]|nr:enoyl-CoA hydratase/isomerase family protein [Candidatus Thermoplasmatota archaeon]
MYVDVARRAGVALLTLDAPDRLNAFGVEDIRALDEAVHDALRDADVGAIVLTGRGRAFCAGADVRAMARSADRPQLFRDLTKHHHEVVRELRTSPKPIVTAVNGVAAGGGFGLALAGDLRVGCPDARFRPGYLALGVPPDGGLTHLLPRAVGPAAAQRIVLEDALVGAEEALRLGILHRVVEAERVVDEAAALAERLAAWPREPFAQTKALLNGTYDNPLTVQLAEERMGIVRAAAAEPLARGVERFLKKG